VILGGRTGRGSLTLLLILAACGASTGDTASKKVGPYGATVSGTQGTSVVIPAGALTQPTDITISKDSTGAPPIPASYLAIGDMYALTPHGTMFAVPVTVNIPFNEMQTDGRTPTLLKTNAARDGWEPIDTATENATTMQAQIDSFSWIVVAKTVR